MKVPLKTSLLLLVMFPSKLLLGHGDRVEMWVSSDAVLKSENIIEILRQEDIVSLDFCPSENIMEAFRIDICPAFLSSFPWITSNVVYIEVNMALYEESDFYVCKLLELIVLLHENNYKIYLQNLDTYIVVDENIRHLAKIKMDEIYGK